MILQLKQTLIGDWERQGSPMSRTIEPTLWILTAPAAAATAAFPYHHGFSFSPKDITLGTTAPYTASSLPFPFLEPPFTSPALFTGNSETIAIVWHQNHI